MFRPVELQICPSAVRLRIRPTPGARCERSACSSARRCPDKSVPVLWPVQPARRHFQCGWTPPCGASISASHSLLVSLWWCRCTVCRSFARARGGAFFLVKKMFWIFTDTTTGHIGVHDDHAHSHRGHLPDNWSGNRRGRIDHYNWQGPLSLSNWRTRGRFCRPSGSARPSFITFFWSKKSSPTGDLSK